LATPETVKVLRSLGYLSGSSNASLPEPRVDPKDRIVDFERYVSALSTADAGKVAESDSTLKSLRDKLPDVVDIKMSVAFNLERRGEDEQAAHEFKRVIEQDPSNPSAHFELGSCYFRLRQYSDAIKQLEAALAIEPWFTRADEALAEIYIQEKAYTQARAHLNHMLSVDPTSYTANYNLGIMAAMEKNWSEAQQRMLRALHTDPGSAEAHTTLGSIYLQRDATERAVHEFEEAIHLQPNFAAAHYNLGLVFQKQGKSEEAAREFRAAQESDRSAGHQR
jgi:tetratricopeptide (TPR) repeat protein